MMFTTVNMGLKNDDSSVQKLSFSDFLKVNTFEKDTQASKL